MLRPKHKGKKDRKRNISPITFHNQLPNNKKSGETITEIGVKIAKVR